VNAVTVLRPVGLPIGLVLAAAVLSSCGGASGLGASGSFTPSTPNTLTVATAQIPDPGFWEGTPEQPTGGFEYGLARALADRFGLAKLKVVIVPFKQIVAGDLGGADIALSDITVTSEREQHLDFSSSYLAAPPSIVVRPGTTVPDVDAAQELTFAVQEGTTLQSALGESIMPEAPPRVFAHQREVLAALRAGRAQAAMLDLPVALAYARKSPHTYAVAAQLHSEDVLAAALPKGSGNVEAVDSAMRAFNSDGTIEGLGHRWLDTQLEEGQAEHVPELRSE
jgi:polar amino acid transport system substrate-binding protein